MLFFLICGALALIVTVTLLLPLWRDGADGTAPSEVDVYRAQLDELERDVARGVIDPEEAGRARTEIARRLLAADRAGETATGRAPRRATRIMAAASAVLVIAGAGGLYAWLGSAGPSGPYPDLPRADRMAAADERRANLPSQAALEAGAEPLPRAEAPEDYREMIAQLREIVPSRPDELRGWELLALHEARLGNFSAAVEAQTRVVALKEEELAPSDLSDLLDLMVAAAGGTVSAEAERVLDRLLGMDDTNTAARFYVGLLYGQTDRPDVAFRIWRELVETAPPGDRHVMLARARVEEAAARAGIDYSLPEVEGGGSGMTGADIEAMVASLSDRLAREGGPASDWARLIVSHSVLGDMDQAAAILAEARQVFDGRPEDIAEIEAAAERAGLE